MQAQRDKVERLLKTARGQLDGILKMVEEDRYCMDMHRVNREIIHAHLQHCVKESLGGEESGQKIEELMALFDKLAK